MDILVVEDDQALGNMVRMLLELEGFRVRLVQTGSEAMTEIELMRPSLILLDVMLPDMSGFELQARIRDMNIPVIFLTAKTHLQDRLLGLKLGADDYITKPFDNQELVLRIKALLKRAHPEYKGGRTIVIGNLVLQLDERALVIDGKTIELTPSEYALMEFFVRHHKVVLSREQLLNVIWETDALGSTTRTIDAHIQRLRKKLGRYKGYIKTVYGIGYKLEVAEERK